MGVRRDAAPFLHHSCNVSAAISPHPATSVATATVQIKPKFSLQNAITELVIPASCASFFLSLQQFNSFSPVSRKLQYVMFCSVDSRCLKSSTQPASVFCSALTD